MNFFAVNTFAVMCIYLFACSSLLILITNFSTLYLHSVMAIKNNKIKNPQMSQSVSGMHVHKTQIAHPFIAETKVVWALAQ